MMADGKGERVGTSMYPGSEEVLSMKDTERTTMTQDYEKAKELLKEAGYADGFDMEITVMLRRPAACGCGTGYCGGIERVSGSMRRSSR